MEYSIKLNIEEADFKDPEIIKQLRRDVENLSVEIFNPIVNLEYSDLVEEHDQTMEEQELKKEKGLINEQSLANNDGDELSIKLSLNH